MNEPKVITVTGITGCGSKGFCSRYAQETKKNVRVYTPGNLMAKLAGGYSGQPPIPKENLPNLRPRHMESLMARAFERIAIDMERNQGNYDRFVINTHSTFFWNDIFREAYSWSCLENIGTDMFITIVDMPSKIRDKQLEKAQGRAQDHNLRDILLWQNVEMMVTRGWASRDGKPMYVLPSAQNSLTIDSLLDNYFLVYFQMPMTDDEGGQGRDVGGFKERLMDIGKKINELPTPIIDPRDIDIQSLEGCSEREARAINRHVVDRDFGFVEGATTQVAYYPKDAPISKGVSSESDRGHETGKDAFVIYPHKNVSPFMGISGRIFRNEDKFFEFFEGYMSERMELFKRR